MRGDFGPPKLILPPDYTRNPAPDAAVLQPAVPAPLNPRSSSPSLLHSKVRARPTWKGKEAAPNPSIPLPTREELRPIAAHLTVNADNSAEVDKILDEMEAPPPMDEDDVYGPEDDPLVPVRVPSPPTGERYLPPSTPTDGFFAASTFANPPS